MSNDHEDKHSQGEEKFSGARLAREIEGIQDATELSGGVVIRYRAIVVRLYECAASFSWKPSDALVPKSLAA